MARQGDCRQRGTIPGRLRVGLLFLTALAWSAGASAVGAGTTEDSYRLRHRLGAFFGFFGEPFPSTVSANIGYNVTDFLRLQAGVGHSGASGVTGGVESRATVISFCGGARFLVPKWSLSPMLGVTWAGVSVTREGPHLVEVKKFKESGSHVYGTLGADWQTGAGLHLAAGYNFSFRSELGGLPYVNVGWFF